jgi:hypothetical protein
MQLEVAGTAEDELARGEDLPPPPRTQPLADVGDSDDHFAASVRRWQSKPRYLARSSSKRTHEPCFWFAGLRPRFV